MSEETKKNEIILNEGYYLDNFLSLINFVYERYQDILNQNEKTFIEDFKKLSVNAQRLYVRLISRKGPYFRKDKISYSEIDNLSVCLNELCIAKFFTKDPYHNIDFALDTLTGKDLEKLIADHQDKLNKDQLKFRRRHEITEHLLNFEEENLWRMLCKKYTFYYPLYFEHITLFKLLFFGNMFQDLSEFILEDIGVLKFESYEIRKEDRYFSERKVVDDTLILSQLRAELWMSVQANDIESVLTIGELMKAYEFHKKLCPKVEKSYTEIGRFTEKFKLWDKALSYYELSEFPPAKERKIRVLEKTGDFQGALNECKELIRRSSNEEELEFGKRFSETLKKKLQLPYKKRTLEKFNTEILEKEINKNKRIEEIVLDHFTENGYTGFYSENGIWKALFALLFWDIMFMPLPEVFFNPFQRGPADLFTPEFKIKREEAFKKRFEELYCSDLEDLVSEIYENKFNTANFLISWKYIKKDQLILLVQIVPKKDIIAVLDRMSRNLKDLKTGFPDLMIFNKKAKSYFLAEVKGPGDQLRPNQRRWLRFFETNNIPYKVINVKAV